VLRVNRILCNILATALEFGSVGTTAGQVIQVLSATDSTQRSTTSSSFVTASNTLSVSITPSSASNKILIIVSGSMYHNTSGSYAQATIYRDSTNLGSGEGMIAVYGGSSTVIANMAMNYLDSPATTSAITYQVYVKSVNGGTAYLQEPATKSSITCLEIKG
jgi:hypothetical protein